MAHEIDELITLSELGRLAEERATERNEAVQRSLGRAVQAGKELRVVLDSSEIPPVEAARLVGSMLNLTLEVAAKLGVDPAGSMTLALRE